MPMAITAENLAEQYGISREDCDKYALQSQTRWGKGKNVNCFYVIPEHSSYICNRYTFDQSLSDGKAVFSFYTPTFN